MKKNKKKTEIRLQINGANGKKPNLIFRTKKLRDRFKDVAKRLIACQLGEVEHSVLDAQWVRVQSEHTKNQLRQLGITLHTESKEKYELRKLTDVVERGLKKVSDSTERYYKRTSERLKEFFGEECDIRRIAEDDAKDYAEWLVDNQQLAASSTARRHAGYASAFFAKAVKEKLIESNPFTTKDIPKNVLSNPEKKHYVDADQTLRLRNVLNDDDDKLRFVLMRYLGLRSPSEINELRWNDFDWNTGLVKIRSPKLIRHKRKYIRHCPFQFAEALSVIKDAYDKRQSDYDKILPSISHKNLTKHVRYWIAAAGLKRWPDLLQNFRRSAENDLLDAGYPQHVVCTWLGHSPKVAQEHYLMTHEGHVADISSVAPRKTRGGAA